MGVYTWGMKKEKECRFGHICTSGCQNDFDCPCLEEHCCEFSEEVCDRTCDDCYWKEKDKEEEVLEEAKRLTIKKD